ncbi:DUF1990 family protein [Bailinhaonella thermotolerans]|uniref:DUF1990 domain-containing protein n=1 Tax=Bailinhaonella thermotolerans TaxID=1070861 RepID=A0A3A4B9V1_9ACTN|nr:DUF1990 domain-containing protein [Bailinhaonella thermotolerans]RJL34504.1 DUF1990 domain-containing protein [Bailinhaonella thermotolerans]
MDVLNRYREAPFTYDEVGATASGPLPAGYGHLRHRARLGPAARFGEAARRLLTWGMHRRLLLCPEFSAPRAAPGVLVISHLGPVRAPCRVVWTIEEPARAGFAYGTLPGHPETGEESFLLTVRGGDLWFEVKSFTRPARWYSRAAGPLLTLTQQAFARAYATALKPR